VLEALRLLEALQSFAKHGILCPVDWKPNVDESGSAQADDSDRKREREIGPEGGK